MTVQTRLQHWRAERRLIEAYLAEHPLKHAALVGVFQDDLRMVDLYIRHYEELIARDTGV